jgi:hypothetical protein
LWEVYRTIFPKRRSGLTGVEDGGAGEQRISVLILLEERIDLRRQSMVHVLSDGLRGDRIVGALQDLATNRHMF